MNATVSTKSAADCCAPVCGEKSASKTAMLDRILSFRTCVGDGLSDNEFTWLMHQNPPEPEAGFTFLGFCGGAVTLGVPQQEVSDWYPTSKWISPEKEKIARGIADKYGLTLHEPPDTISGYQDPYTGAHQIHHHIELGSHKETIIIAHPRYLKIRLYVGNSAVLCARATRNPQLLEPGLLSDLAALYQNVREK